jgi:uncharacterized protein (TIGR01370 family)
VPAITSFLLQYTNVNFNTLFSSTFDLIITEGAPLPRPNSFPQLTDNQVDQLQAQGRRVAGYVNVSVTDTVRSYWNSAWTSNGDDLGTLTGAAPSWLQGQPANSFGRIVKFWDPAWQQIVIDQAVNLVNRGYRAIFLDDVAQYFVLGAPVSVERIRELATLMAEFVTTITNAVRQINSDVTVIVNSDPYLVTNVTGDARGSAAATAFLAAVDYHLMENQSATAIGWAETAMPGEPLLLLDTRSPPLYSNDEAWTHGVPYYTPGYDTLGMFSYRATNGADALYGGDGPNQINGLGGNDVIDGRGGNDTLDGGIGADSLNGGAGDDTIRGDSSDTFLDGGIGTDTLAIATSGTFSMPITGFEALNLIGDAAVILTASQLINGFTATSMINGAGTLTVNMDAPGTFISKLFTFVGNGVSLVVNGTSGNDVFKLGNGRHTINAGDGSDQIKGGSAADTINGGVGADKINGDTGADILTGGAGSDIFKYAAASDSGIWDWTIDRITDFEIGLDKLNFAKIDARPELAGDQAFRFVGTGSFSGGAGCIRYTNSGSDLRVEVDLDGGGSADMVIILENRAGSVLTAADFVL